MDLVLEILLLCIFYTEGCFECFSRVLTTLIACALLRHWDSLEVQGENGEIPRLLAAIASST